MGLVETEAIVLRTYKLAEADKIVVCLTKGTGVVRGVARGARRLKSRFGAGLEPLTLVSLVYYEKENRELVSLRQVEILRSYFGLAKNAETIHALEYLSELVLEFSPPHEPNEKMFRMVKACVEALACAPEKIHAIVRYFEVWALKLAGFLPDLQKCRVCGRAFGEGEKAHADTDGALRCAKCTERREISAEGAEINGATLAQLRRIQRVSPYDYANAGQELSTQVRQEMAFVTQRLIARALERAPRAQESFV